MTSSELSLVAAIALVCLLTVLGGIYGLRLSRTTSDFYVAGRAVGPWRNASAIGGEYLSAASFLGVAGLLYASGVSMLWFPVGYTLGYVVLACMVAAPLRRSGAYTVPDFAELRLESRAMRLLTSVLVVLIGWLYLLPQLHGAGIAVTNLTGAPSWVGNVLVSTVVTINVVSGGMRSVTLVQAVQYWVKLAAIAIPALVLIGLWVASGSPAPTMPTPVSLQGVGMHTYSTYSLILALCLGTMGLPHVVVRFYTNPDGRGARRTALAVIGLLGAFYLFPPIYAVLGRVYLPELPPGMLAEEIVLELPHLAAPGLLGDCLVVVLAVGAFAAFLSTASGLAVAITGVVDQDIIRPRLNRMLGSDVDGIASFRLAALVSMLIPSIIALLVGRVGLATTVGLAFAVAASTLCPLIVLGVWWRGLSVTGAAAGMIVGAATSLLGVAVTLSQVPVPQPWALWFAQPAAWSVPMAFFTACLVSLATPGRVPTHTLRTMTRLHTPENVSLSLTRRGGV
ncbi:sodium/solute symporter [Gephyromycinifex aptenodytis]|uniref:sodium/solute symporter n=1 Tax=Gephyromycinifex aptenodytis TaxID=2716227 RepID=UPI001445B4CF|nr:cation acetate symporter [Gephyromycinifex aptenodytis]